MLYITPLSIATKNILNSIILLEFLQLKLKSRKSIVGNTGISIKLILPCEKTNLNKIQFETNSILPRQQFSLKSDLIIYPLGLVYNYATCN